MSAPQRFSVLPGRFAICRLAPGSPVPVPPAHAAFWSVSVTPDEISLICDEASSPVCESIERVWRAIKIEGPLDFSLTGILCHLLDPLAKLELGVFAVSTYDTDYLFVKELDLAAAVLALEGAGHKSIP
jgi:hypothetical protein